MIDQHKIGHQLFSISIHIYKMIRISDEIKTQAMYRILNEAFKNIEKYDKNIL